MHSARFDAVSTGGWFAALPRFHAVMTWGETEEACYHAPQADLESAIDEALRNKRQLPEFVGISIPELDQSVNS